MRTAVIGCGVIGRVHLRVCLHLNRDVVAVCDIDAEKAKTVSSDYYKDVQIYTDYKKMLDEVKPDVVHICTPHYLHVEMIVYALERNINVMCEKPLCINKEEMQTILDAEEKSKAQLGVSLQNRYNVSSRFAKQYLEEHKATSGFANVVWCRGKDYYASADWRGKWATEGGGVMINQALHTLDLMQWFLGMPEYCTAITDNLSLKNVIEVEDSAMARFDGEKGFTFFATNSGQENYNVEMNIMVEGKTMKITPDSVFINGEKVAEEQIQEVLGKKCYGGGHVRLIDEFYNCVENGKKFAVDGKETAKVMKLIFAMYESKGQKIKV